MDNEYLKAAERLLEISEQHKDNAKISRILKDGSFKAVELARKKGLIVKVASVESKETPKEETK